MTSASPSCTRAVGILSDPNNGIARQPNRPTSQQRTTDRVSSQQVCAHIRWLQIELNLMVSVILSWSKVNEKLLRKRYDHHHRITEWNVVVKNNGLRYCYL